MLLQSFFAWHVEDADLYSVNFLHGGAPKIWYCVSPKDKAKFERLAGTLNPEQLRSCKGFLRHKDILISPTVLKQFDIKYQLVRSALVHLVPVLHAPVQSVHACSHAGVFQATCLQCDSANTSGPESAIHLWRLRLANE